MARRKNPSFKRPYRLGKALTAEQLRSLLHYDPETGIFTWHPRAETDGNMRHWNVKFANKPAGCKKTLHGYHAIGIYDHLYLAHRLVWLYMTGKWPTECIDHINMVRHDNRFANLREATHSENHYNRSIQSNNAAGFKGVYLHKSGLWAALISHEGRKISLGYYQSAELAGAAYRGAERVLRGVWRDRDHKRGMPAIEIYKDD